MHLLYKRLSILLVVLFLITLSCNSAQAAIIPIYGNGSDINKDNAAKIKDLQRGEKFYLPVSAPSPDGKFMLLYTSSGKPQLLNLEDGSTKEFEFKTAPYGVLALLLGVTDYLLEGFKWKDNDNFTYVGLDLKATKAADSILMVSVNRNTLEETRTPLKLTGGFINISPDGSRILTVKLPPSVFSLFSERSLVEQLMSRTYFDVELQVSDLEPMRAASRELEIGILDTRTNEYTPLLNAPENTVLWGSSWSADSSKLALSRGDFANIRSLSGSSALLKDLLAQDALGLLAPEKNPFLQTNVLDTFDLNGKNYRPAAIKAKDGNGDLIGKVEYNSDGSVLMVQMKVPSHLQDRPNPVYYVRQERSYLRFYNSNGELLNTFDSPEINAPGIDPNFPTEYKFGSNEELLVTTVNATDKPLYYYHRFSGEFRRLPVPAGTVEYWRVGSKKAVFVHSSFTNAREIFVMDLDGKNLKQLTFANKAYSDKYKTRADRVDFTLKDGTKLWGWLIQKADAPFPAKNVPLVVWQQGGPGVPMLNRWSTRVEDPYDLLPQFGMAVLFVPLAGREGFGPTFHNALVEGDNFGKLDIDQMAEIVQQLIANGTTSGERVGITGCSYGGYFVAQSITRHPNLYAAANPQCGLYDLHHEWQFGLTALTYYMLGKPVTLDNARYTQASPLYNSQKVKTPTLIFHGSADFLDARIAKNFHDQLQDNGVPVNLYEFSGAGHGISSQTQQNLAAQLQVDWFTKYLKVG